MNTESYNLRLKRCPAGEPREQTFARVAQLAEQSALNRTVVGSKPSACTMDTVTSALGRVVRPAHPCGEQQVRMRGRGPKAGHLSYKQAHVGSSPTARTVRMRIGASVEAGAQGAQISHKDLAKSSSLFTGTKPRRRREHSHSSLGVA